MLRIVHPAPQGQPTRPPHRPRTIHSLAPAERRALQVALRNLRRAYGTWACLAEVMNLPKGSVCKVANGQEKGSPGMALRAARAAGMPLERVLSSALMPADMCPTCGRSADGRAS